MTELKVGESSFPAIATVYQEFLDSWEDPARRQTWLELYQRGQVSFVPNVLPEQVVQLTGEETLHILRSRFGEAVNVALSAEYADPDYRAAELPTILHSPVADQPDSGWLKWTNMVGINARTVGSFWNMIKYALTLPATQDSIHMMPIWEPGVAGSIYGMSSWQLNQEFYSSELALLCPALDTIEKQLRAVVHLLHVMGKAIGMDVIPHTERFSEMVLAFPEYFEWLQREDTIIVDHSADLHLAVQKQISAFLHAYGPAMAGDEVPPSRDELFHESSDEAQRMRLLFGLPRDVEGRRARRGQLIHHLFRYGYEPVPATMAPPFRGLQVDLRPEARSVDSNEQIWREYQITQPTPMSRVFGPLARYKLYEPLDNNANWEIDFSQPRQMVWQYVCGKYAEMQRSYGFDFMRGDMAHVQMRPFGVPSKLDRYYDILGAVKQFVQQERGIRSFGYFAETFIAPRDVMGYGDEFDHLEAAEADTTLGDLQSTAVGSPEFLQRLRYYIDLATTRQCVPNFTVMTADKDDPRFDSFYLSGNAVRLFLALFQADMPSYMGIGFESRDIHDQPAANEQYTKLYIFKETDGPKATHGPYQWGKNGFLFGTITRMKLYLDAIWPTLQGRATRWLIPPSATASNAVVAWTQKDKQPDYVFMANTHPAQVAIRFGIPGLPAEWLLRCEFSTASSVLEVDRQLASNGKQHRVITLAAGEGRVYRVLEQDEQFGETVHGPEGTAA
ncbi:MAG: hypothetical protein H0X37_14915 [Herpetosiphonaceae bacterium]|nr:hypothetical protein [Herpetosiphonaceae bacterium]